MSYRDVRPHLTTKAERSGIATVIAVCLLSAVGCSAEVVDPIDRATSALSCTFNRRLDLTLGAAQLDPLGPGSLQEPSVIAGSRIHTVAPIVTGSVPTEDHDSVLVTTTCTGSTTATRYGTPHGDEAGYTLVLSHDGVHVLVAGRANLGVWIAKIRLSDRSVVWSQRIGDNGVEAIAHAIERLPSDVIGAEDYLVAGQVRDLGAGWSRVFAIRVADDGTVRYSRRYHVGADDQFSAGILLRGGIAYLPSDTVESATGDRVFSILAVRVSTGDPDVAHYYPSPVPGFDMAAPAPRLNRGPDGYLASYTLRLPSSEIVPVLLRLDGSFDPIWERAFEAASEGGARSSFVMGGRFALSYAANGSSAVLTTDYAGNLLSNDHYFNAAPGPAGVSPASRSGDQLLLRTLDGSSLSLTTVDVITGSAACRAPLATTVTDIPRVRVTHRLGSTPWGAALAHPVAVSDASPVTISDLCR